jgi:hypothetical protein
MGYYNEGKHIKETTENKTLAISTYDNGSEIIVKALNFYFGDTYTRNEAVEMMHQNTANAFKSTADFFQKEEYTAEMIIEYLRETAEAMEAQAIVVSMRDELKFGKAIE